MQCAECDRKAAPEDYLCRECRLVIQPCIHSGRRKATDAFRPSEHEMERVANFVDKLDPPSVHFCECCGNVEGVHGSRCLICHFYEWFPNGSRSYVDRNLRYSHGY